MSADGSGTKLIQDHATSTLTFRLPGSGTAVKSPVQALESLPETTSIALAAGVPVVAPKPTPTPTPVSATFAPTESSRVPTVPPPATPAVVSSSKVNVPASQVAVEQRPRYSSATQHTHYPNATYHPVAQPIAAPKHAASGVPTAAPINQLRNAHFVSRSPAPSLSGHRPLKEVFVIMKPRERSFWLDHRDGVKSWAMKLAQSRFEWNAAAKSRNPLKSVGGEEGGHTALNVTLPLTSGIPLSRYPLIRWNTVSMPWSEAVMEQFSLVDRYTTEESDWYMPFNALLFELLPPSEHYQITPQYKHFKSSLSIISSTKGVCPFSSLGSKYIVLLPTSLFEASPTIRCATSLCSGFTSETRTFKPALITADAHVLNDVAPQDIRAFDE